MSPTLLSSLLSNEALDDSSTSGFAYELDFNTETIVSRLSSSVFILLKEFELDVCTGGVVDFS
jgi:hypothetical protein